jgi:hypothetical protein
MAAKKADMQRLIDQRDQFLLEIEALRNKIAGVEIAIALLESSESGSSGRNRPDKKSIKVILLDLLQEVGTTGLNAAAAVEIAERRGWRLDRGTVSSLLSRLKRDGAITYDGERYKLAKFATIAKDAEGEKVPPFLVVSVDKVVAAE